MHAVRTDDGFTHKTYPIEALAFIVQGFMVYGAEQLKHESFSDIRYVTGVPAYFSSARQRAVWEALTAGGIIPPKKLTLVEEPTLQLLGSLRTKHGDLLERVKALHARLKTKERLTIGVGDMGGGTFDVSVLNMSKSSMDDSTLVDVVDTGGDNHLGGKDFKAVLCAMLGGDGKAIAAKLDAQMAELCGQTDRDAEVGFG